MQKLEALNFDNTYARLPDAFFAHQPPTPMTDPYMVSFNADVAKLIDLHPEEGMRAEFLEYFSGQRTLPGSSPLAMLYAGHQFGHFVPQLGDGRAILLGEVRNQSGEHWDLHLKGGGPTPFSRSGDGRAVLRSTIREYLCSEAMHGLGIPTSRALCIVGSDMEVYRESIETGATLMRVSPSHVRFGTFEVFFYRGQKEQVKILADYVIAKHFPELVEPEDKYPRFLQEVVLRTARLMAKWQAVGFAHGVMNTDNMSILGLTLDYGPFGFLDNYDAGYICNHSDHQGRYAFDQQPDIGAWNLTCLAQALTPLMSVDEAKEALNHYQSTFASHYIDLMSAKLGLKESGKLVVPLITDLLDILHKNHIDYTIFFRALANFKQDATKNNATLRDMFIDREAFDNWAREYKLQLDKENSADATRRTSMLAANPKYILRNYLAQNAISKATDEKDFSEIDRLLHLLKTPFDEQPEMARYAAPPPDWANKIQVSCSS
ncbi:protein adenylyltransferase SelO [Sulfurirhabdus autotrophica]|uniref:Protein nucleotidyltransferase YdiU n=1 Tax=Sulfurirhabdus autotrophica TaxID=1706046 RepID=A0A4R3Y3K1_9PROT|nr:YdiU family protein [Sulfurirhabdus autotrophica]TCV86775.1 hypothetical protein EDC63_106136 [Sulfurirhabdus autotrophica]